MRCHKALFALTTAVSALAFTIQSSVHGVSQLAQVAPIVNLEEFNRWGVGAGALKALPEEEAAESTREKKIRRVRGFGKAHADFARLARRQGNESDNDSSSTSDSTDCSDGSSSDDGTSTAADSVSGSNSPGSGNSGSSSSTSSGEDEGNGQDGDDCGEDEGVSTTTSAESSTATTGSSSSYNSSNKGSHSIGGSSASSSTPQATSSSSQLSNQDKHHNGGSSSSSTAAQAQATSSSSSSSGVQSGSGSTYSGMATFFYQDGAAGACGNYNHDSTPLVAIDRAMYDGGKWCGKTVAITRTSTGKTINAIVQDMCPGCSSSGSLDLSVASFTQLGTEDEGTFPINWKFVN